MVFCFGDEIAHFTLEIGANILFTHISSAQQMMQHCIGGREGKNKNREKRWFFGRDYVFSSCLQ